MASLLLQLAPLTAVGVLILHWCWSVLRRPDGHPKMRASLSGIQWLFPVKGRWLQYLVAVFVGLLGLIMLLPALVFTLSILATAMGAHP
jgi:hypothetical protein